MRLIFMGTPDFAVPTLLTLIDAGHDIAAVYTRPPKPAGRGMAEHISPVHRVAAERNIPVETPASLKGSTAARHFEDFEADAAVVVAYGLILPREILSGARLGAFNVHASLLPRWRGAAPISRAIMAGDRETGVTIMQMDEGLDTGLVCHSDGVTIAPETTAGELHDVISELGARLMREALVLADAGLLSCVPQSTNGVSYARKISKDETRIDFAKPARDVRNHVHGLSPWPGAWFPVPHEEKPLRIKALLCEAVDGTGEPGEVLDDRLTVASGEGAVRFLKLQREGKAPMIAETFLRGTPVLKGTRL